MNNIEIQINDLVTEINKMIDNLNSISIGLDDAIQYKVDEVRSKATNVLSVAGNRVVSISKTISDEEEVRKGIEIVRGKSRILYDNAIKKINEIKKERQDEINKSLLDDLNVEVDTFIEEEKEKEEVKEVVINEDKDEIAKLLGDALNLEENNKEEEVIEEPVINECEEVRILRTWLKPEVK